MLIKRIFACITLFLLCFSLVSCAAQSKPLSETRFMLNTFCTITVYDKRDSEVVEAAFSECERYEKLFSKTLPESDIFKVNSAGGAPVLVSEDTISILRKANYYYELSGGMFNCAIGAITDLWPFGENFSQPPEADDIAKALKTIGDSRDIIVIDEENMTVALSDPRARLDLGGIAKGYIADRLKEFLYNEGIRNAIIDLGGNVLVMGGKQGGAPFRVGIKEPNPDTNGVIAYVDTKEQSVVTSGIYERGKWYGGEYYHHIIDPETGYPADTDVVSVTILSENSVDGDALSTICVLFGYEKGMELIKSLENTEALFVLKGGSLQKTTEIIKNY